MDLHHYVATWLPMTSMKYKRQLGFAAVASISVAVLVIGVPRDRWFNPHEVDSGPMIALLIGQVSRYGKT